MTMDSSTSSAPIKKSEKVIPLAPPSPINKSENVVLLVPPSSLESNKDAIKTDKKSDGDGVDLDDAKESAQVKKGSEKNEIVVVNNNNNNNNNNNTTISSDETEASDNETHEQQEEKETETTEEKPVVFGDATKKTPRMTSVDDYTMLGEGYKPNDEDVICSWARQNVSKSLV
jgi:hypothetical protein